VLIIAETGNLDLLDDGVLEVRAPHAEILGHFTARWSWGAPCLHFDLRMEIEHMYFNF